MAFRQGALELAKGKPVNLEQEQTRFRSRAAGNGLPQDPPKPFAAAEDPARLAAEPLVPINHLCKISICKLPAIRGFTTLGPFHAGGPGISMPSVMVPLASVPALAWTTI